MQITRPRKKDGSVVGLVVEPGFVAAAQVSVNGVLGVERCAYRSLEPALVPDGEVTDPDGLALAIKALFADSGLDSKVRVGIASSRVVVRTLDLPPLLSGKDLDAAVRFQATDELPIPLDQAVLDYQLVGAVDTADGPRTRVIVVVAVRDSVMRLLTAVRRAGLKPAGVDLSAFAMIRALHRPEGAEPLTTLYVNAAGMTTLAVAHAGTCVFTRVAASGIEAMANALAPRHELTVEHARGWLEHVGRVPAGAPVEGDERIVASARDTLDEGVRRVAADVQGTLTFYGQQPGAEPVRRVVLTGPAAALPAFVEGFGAALGTEVEVGRVPEVREGALNGIAAETMAVPAGLAVTEVAS